MCKCEICKMRSRAVTWIDRKVVCASCLGQMLDGAHLPVRNEPGNKIAMLTEERDLIITTELAWRDAAARAPDSNKRVGAAAKIEGSETPEAALVNAMQAKGGSVGGPRRVKR